MARRAEDNRQPSIEDLAGSVKTRKQQVRGNRRLTAKGVKAETEPGYHLDGDGLYLQVTDKWRPILDFPL